MCHKWENTSKGWWISIRGGFSIHQIPCASPFIVRSMADTAVFVLRGDTNTQLNGEEEKLKLILDWLHQYCSVLQGRFGVWHEQGAPAHTRQTQISHFTINMHERLHSNKAGLFLVARNNCALETTGSVQRRL